MKVRAFRKSRDDSRVCLARTGTFGDYRVVDRHQRSVGRFERTKIEDFPIAEERAQSVCSEAPAIRTRPVNSKVERHAEEKPSARAQDARDLCERVPGSDSVLENLCENDVVERPVIERVVALGDIAHVGCACVGIDVQRFHLDPGRKEWSRAFVYLRRDVEQTAWPWYQPFVSRVTHELAYIFADQSQVFYILRAWLDLTDHEAAGEVDQTHVSGASSSGAKDRGTDLQPIVDEQLDHADVKR